MIRLIEDPGRGTSPPFRPSENPQPDIRNERQEISPHTDLEVVLDPRPRDEGQRMHDMRARLQQIPLGMATRDHSATTII